MKLTNLHEAKYDHGRTLEKIMSFTTDEGRIRDGFELRINNNPIEFIGYYNPADPNDPMYNDYDPEESEPFFVVTQYGKEDPDTLHPEDFLPHVEVYELRRVL